MEESGNGLRNGTSHRKLVIIIGGFVLMLMLCCCIVAVVIFREQIFSTVNTVLDGGGDSNIGFILILLIGATLLLMILPIGIILLKRLQQAKTLDIIFKPFGLSGTSYLVTGRQYHGKMHGRDIDIYILRGPTIEIKMSGLIQTHFQSIRTGNISGPVLQYTREESLHVDFHGLEGINIYGPDEVWINKLFSDSHAILALKTLLTEGIDWAVFRRVEVKPGEASVILYRSRRLMFNLDLSVNEVNTLLTKLAQLLHAMETAPQPAKVEEIKVRDGQKSVDRMNPNIVFLIIAIVVGLPACLIIGGFLLTLMASGSL
ncbi:MAG: hypothetical protein JEZ00_12030 [Anaerolineaceae bacterium]|nr:hypothetical protein [Anaerolineaceae bacterium]